VSESQRKKGYQPCRHVGKEHFSLKKQQVQRFRGVMCLVGLKGCKEASVADAEEAESDEKNQRMVDKGQGM
jgi:hypothetical protein